MDIESFKANPDIVRLNPELQGPPVGAARRKYGNVPTLYNGRHYASRKEATRARDLDLLVKAGEIAAWCAQVPLPLAGGIRYVADFIILGFDGSWRAEDTKGFRTKEYKLKRKLFKEKYGREIIEV